MPVRDLSELSDVSPALHIAKAEVQAEEIRHLSRPFWATVFIGAISLLIFVTLLARSLDRNAIQSSEQIFRSMLSDRIDRLEDITLEYGYWDDAVENLVGGVNRSWVDETLVGYIQAELQIDAVHVLDADGIPVLHVVDDEIADADLSALYGDGLNRLIERARSTEKDQAPTTATGLVGNLSALSLLSAVQMTTYEDDTDKSTDHILVFAQSIDDQTLSALAERYRLSNLHLSAIPPGILETGYEIDANDGNGLGYFVWSPDLPGLRLLPYLLAGLLAVYGTMFLTARLFSKRATELVKALAVAKSQAEDAKEQLAEQVRRDPLTGLGNRRYLDEKLAELHTVEAPSKGHAMLYLDLDRFKEINDTYGHDTGDEVLQAVARKLAEVAGETDTVLRVGGDEFVVIFGSADRDEVLRTGRSLLEILSRPVTLSGVEFSLGGSVGLAFSNNPSELLRQADVALYSAKRQGRGQVAVYSADLLDLSKSPLHDIQ